MPKGEKVSSLKQKDRTTTNFKIFKNFSNWYLSIFNLIQFSIYKKIGKALLNTKRSILFRGSFVKSKAKHLTQGEKFQILKMLLAILFIYL
jgi:hypothetical protein